MSLAAIKNTLSRAEMKKIMAGSGYGACYTEYSICGPTTPCCAGLSCQSDPGNNNEGPVNPFVCLPSRF